MCLNKTLSLLTLQHSSLVSGLKFQIMKLISSEHEGLCGQFNNTCVMYNMWLHLVCVETFHILWCIMTLLDFYCVLGSCSSVGRAGGPVIGKSLIWIPVPVGWYWATCRSILEQDTEPQNCSWCAVGTLWRQPLPSVRVLRWAGYSSRVYPGLHP